MMVYLVVIIITIVALAYVTFNYFKLRSMKEGNSDMVENGDIIRNGARTFMRAEYKTIVPVIAIVAVIFSCFIEKTSGITFILGATMSSLACVIGMRSATYANVRTANTALETKNIGKTTQTALRGGSISGLSVPAFGRRHRPRSNWRRINRLIYVQSYNYAFNDLQPWLLARSNVQPHRWRQLYQSGRYLRRYRCKGTPRYARR